MSWSEGSHTHGPHPLKSFGISDDARNFERTVRARRGHVNGADKNAGPDPARPPAVAGATGSHDADTEGT
ncbi:hypothetical protein SAMN05216505_101549 [Streptomyces prasinopilosus]|uniref:Uncharacterized protein n=1 Tax=Streptomyces prasinopilosus TaxID=67344 RepID=A0A1G6J7D5_9ACTN|nr:hypothetical protein SAMN05216505_101549 [Streptomyces prasinopilosus]